MKNSDFELFVDPFTKEKLFLNDGKLVSSNSKYEIKDNIIPDLLYPFKLASEERQAQNFYNGRAKQYDDTLHLTFFTHGLDEKKVRNSFIDRLNIKDDSKILEIACGTGRDSELIAARLKEEGELHMMDISDDMLAKCYSKLLSVPIKKSFCLANSLFLPYPDNYFDAVYSFGAIGEFSDIAKSLAEMVRVTKLGGKIVFGDESIPIWLRETEFYKILLTTNPMFSAQPPLTSIPIEARNVNLSWVIGMTFYLMEFEVGNGEPTANFDFSIPGTRGGSYRSRYLGQLEGVSVETKARAWEYVLNNGLNMHDWLNKIILENIK